MSAEERPAAATVGMSKITADAMFLDGGEQVIIYDQSSLDESGECVEAYIQSDVVIPAGDWR
jgi:hypothetical protein